MQVRGFAMVTATILLLCAAPASMAQVDKDGNDPRFHDDLLDHLVGRWEVNALVHGQEFTLDRKAEWVMNHQYVRIYEKSREVVPWLKVRFERTMFIGYNHSTKRYLVYELTVHGGDVPHQPEGFYYAERSGNQLNITLTKGPEIVGYQRFTWEPASASWRFQGGRVVGGKEQPNIDQTAVAAKPLPNPTGH